MKTKIEKNKSCSSWEEVGLVHFCVLLLSFSPMFMQLSYHLYCQVKAMVGELDMLLDSIEKRGGFKDSCIVSHKSQVEDLEQGIETLSHQCTMWKVSFTTRYIASLFMTRRS